MALNHAVPNGFTRVERRSPFLDLLGDCTCATTTGIPCTACASQPSTPKNRGAAHSGALMTVADLVLGYTTAFASDPPLQLTTARLSIDFVDGA